MAIKSVVSNQGKTLSISIDGRFDAGHLNEFRQAYENVGDGEVSEYVVDLKETEHLDSSALGMLLILRDYAGGDEANVTISNCSPEVKKIFSISNFQQLFTIN